MKKLKKILFKFYLNNYRGIHHITNIILFIIILNLFGLTEVNDLSGKHAILQLIFLATSYFICEWALKKVGFHDEVKKELESIKKSEI